MTILPHESPHVNTFFSNSPRFFSDRLPDRIRTASEALRCVSSWASAGGSSWPLCGFYIKVYQHPAPDHSRPFCVRSGPVRDRERLPSGSTVRASGPAFVPAPGSAPDPVLSLAPDQPPKFVFKFVLSSRICLQICIAFMNLYWLTTRNFSLTHAPGRP